MAGQSPAASGEGRRPKVLEAETHAQCACKSRIVVPNGACPGGILEKSTMSGWLMDGDTRRSGELSISGGNGGRNCGVVDYRIFGQIYVEGRKKREAEGRR